MKSMHSRDGTVRLAGVELGQSRHICAFFHSKEEEYRTLMPFIREGFGQRHKAFHIVDPNHRSPHLQRMRDAGIDVDGAEATGQLEVRCWQDAYLRNGHFDPNAMLGLLEDVLITGQAQEFPLVRLVANMEWALEDHPGVEDLVEYETRLNFLLPRYNAAVCCTYDLAGFGGDIVVEILRTHPIVILGGILQENPFFVPPDEMLREVRSRARPVGCSHV